GDARSRGSGGPFPHRRAAGDEVRPRRRHRGGAGAPRPPDRAGKVMTDPGLGGVTSAVAALPVTAVDCHAHVMRRDLPLTSERHSAPKRDVTVEEYVGVLDAFGISHGVLTAPSF